MPDNMDVDYDNYLLTQSKDMYDISQDNDLIDQLRKAKAYNEALETRNKALETRNEDLETRNEDLETRNEDLERMLLGLQGEHLRVRDDTPQYEIENLKKQLNKIKTENNRLNVENDNLKFNFNNVSAEVNDLNCKLKDKYNKRSKELSDKDSEIRELQRKLNENKNSELSKKERELQRKDEDINKLQKLSNDRNSELINKDSEIKKLQQNLKQLQKNLDNIKSDNTNELSKKESKIREFHCQNEELSKNLEKLQKELDESKSLNKTNSIEIKEFKRENEELRKKLDDHKKHSNTGIRELQNKNEEYLKEQLSMKESELRKEFSNLLQKNEKEKQELIEKNERLKSEASQYQSALGNATNFRMNDDDNNHSVQIRNDILDLQDMLKNYVTSLKGNIEVDFDTIKDLMRHYKIDTKITSKSPNKPLIRAVLQYHILKKILTDADKFFEDSKDSGLSNHLEAGITSKSKELIDRLDKFSKTRKGTDTISYAASIRVRQEVNIALGNRGFSDVFSAKNGPQEHQYIVTRKNDLNKEINKYRKISDDKKRQSVEEMASTIIRESIRIIRFRLMVQEPCVQMKWVDRKAKIDPNIMQGSWDEDDIDNLEVEVCSFPMIGRDLDDEKRRKIFTHAQVFPTKKTRKKVNPLGISLW